MALIKCPECQKEISDSAPSCPSCGYVLKGKVESSAKPEKPKKKRGCLTVVIIILLFLVVAGIMGNDSKDKSASSSLPNQSPSQPTQASAAKPAKPDTQASAAKPAKPDFTVSASQIAGEYSNNEIAADQKYQGKKVRITANIEDIGKDILNEPYITFSDGKEFSFSGVQCYFKKSDQGKLGSLRKGQKVTIEGIVEGLMMNVLMKDCVLLN
jgi:hypothetical protein